MTKKDRTEDLDAVESLGGTPEALEPHDASRVEVFASTVNVEVQAECPAFVQAFARI